VRMWEAMCKVIDRVDLLEDPRFATGSGRAEHEEILNAEIAAWCRTKTKHEAMTLLADAGVAASAIMDTQDVFHDPHLQARGFVQEVPHPEYGSVLLLDKPFRLEKSDVPLRAAPVLTVAPRNGASPALSRPPRHHSEWCGAPTIRSPCSR